MTMFEMSPEDERKYIMPKTIAAITATSTTTITIGLEISDFIVRSLRSVPPGSPIVDHGIR